MRIVENLLTHLPDVDEIAFVYGSLAPDSGLPNADWTVFDPPKEVTHFLQRGEGENAIRDYLFYKQYLTPIISLSDKALYSFRLGYFFHLICDSIWSRKIASTTIKAFEIEIQTDSGKAWNSIKKDWYGLDQVYVHGHRECLFWRVMAATSNPPSHLPFISDAAFHQQLDYIRNFYSFPQPEWITPRIYPYLNENTMRRIVADSTEIILRIWENHQHFDEMAITETTLRSVPEEYLLPYEMPLVDSSE